MRLFYLDLIKVFSFLIIWGFLYIITSNNNSEIVLADFTFKYLNIHEVIKIFPFYSFICLGYYAILSICYKVVFINDCEKEFNELTEEIANERRYVDSISKNMS